MVYDLTQVSSDQPDLELKYRFLHVTDTGDLVPIYSSSQSVTQGAGDVLLTIHGYEGSGFERCEHTTQTLTHGSQYQKSILPELIND